MRATTATLENNRVKLTVEVDETEMSSAMDAAAASLSQRVAIKGFRKGKVPKQVLIANIGGVAALRGEAIRESLPDFYAKAVVETSIDPIGQPDVTITAGEDEGILTFEAEVEVRPEIEISGYQQLRVTIASPVVSDDDLENQINRFRETDAVLEDVDRPIVTGDLVSMDIKAEQGDAESEPFEMNDFMYTVGSQAITPEVDGLILGLRAGEDLTVSAPAGESTVTYSLHLKQVKERILPELTDEWVEENTEWPTVSDMREAVFTQMSKMRISEAQMSRRDATLLALGDLVAPDVVPQVLIDAEANERLHDLGHRLAEQKMDFEQFLAATGQTPDVLLESIKADALNAVRIDLGLRSLVRAEGLEATDEEIAEELEKTAESMSVAAQELRKNLDDSGRAVAFASEVAKMKAQRWLNDHVTYVDQLGLVIDTALLDADQSLDEEQ